MGASKSRRQVLQGAAAAVAVASVSAIGQTRPAGRSAPEPFGYCLNTSTIRGANLTIVEELEIAAKTGYQAVEPWISEISDYQKKGGSLKDLSKRIVDQGLTIEDTIGFDEWIVDDDTRRAKGLEALKRDMDLVAQIGAKRIAAPPIGANNADAPVLDLRKAAERYRAVLELGDQAGVQPLVELWGPSKNLSRLEDVAFVALAAEHPKAAMLLDLYHLHKGGSDFVGLRLLNGAALPLIHTNDWPDIPREKLGDANRVYPGDGIASFPEILRTLHGCGFNGYLSLELFNRDYWKQSPLKVAQAGINKMRAVVQNALAGR